MALWIATHGGPRSTTDPPRHSHDRVLRDEDRPERFGVATEAGVDLKSIGPRRSKSARGRGRAPALRPRRFAKLALACRSSAPTSGPTGANGARSSPRPRNSSRRKRRESCGGRRRRTRAQPGALGRIRDRVRRRPRGRPEREESSTHESRFGLVRARGGVDRGGRSPVSARRSTKGWCGAAGSLWPEPL